MPEKLEVNEEAAQLRLERQLRVVGSSSGLISGPPSIGPVARSSILENVKRFLPEMAKADEDLQQRIESGENLDIEGCSGDLSCIDIRGAALLLTLAATGSNLNDFCALKIKVVALYRYTPQKVNTWKTCIIYVVYHKH